MKQLKFRAWHKERKVMLFGTAGKDGGLVFVKPADMYADDREEIGYRNKDLEIMQFIGLKDSAGREIYEGDVVVDNNGDKSSVIYSEENACFKPFEKVRSEEVKIVGNIFN